jgi:hypothetical protein
MTGADLEWGIAFIVAGVSFITGIIGNILAGIAIEIEKMERKDKPESKNYKEYRKMFSKYFIVLLVIAIVIIGIGFYLVGVGS